MDGFVEWPFEGDPELFFDSVENNILLGDKKEADDYLKAVCMAQEVAEMADGKKTVVGNGGVRLSGGQAKRLALARTLCHKKPVLILDDPFSALDKNTEKQIFANLKQQTKDNIVFLISHRLYLFPQMNQVIWMEDGKAVAGTHEEILEKIPEHVIVETAKGVEYGTVVVPNREMAEEKIVAPLKKIIRVATPKDEDIELKNREKEKDAYKIC